MWLHIHQSQKALCALFITSASFVNQTIAAFQVRGPASNWVTAKSDTKEQNSLKL